MIYAISMRTIAVIISCTIPFMSLSTTCGSSSRISKSSSSSLFLPKPQGFYSMHYLRPHDDFQKRCSQPSLVSTTLRYNQSLRHKDITTALWGTDRLSFKGSQVAGRDPNNDLIADNFGLAPDFEGLLSAAPSIKNISFDLFYRVDLSAWCSRLFFEIAAPLVHSIWNLNLSETIINRGSFIFPCGDVTSCLPLSDSISQATAATIQNAVSGNFIFGDMQEPWRAGKILDGKKTVTRLADISVALGTTIYHSDSWTVDCALLTLIPTGNTYNPTFLFTPLVGNSGRWELGMTMHTYFSHTFFQEHTLNLHLYGTFTHPFNTEQRRTFDFVDRGLLSRYLLLKALTITPVNTINTFTYDNLLINGVNFATRAVRTGCAAQGDITLQGCYTYKGLTFEAGYVFYGRSQEDLHLIAITLPEDVQGRLFVIKGTEGSCARLYANDPVDSELPSLPLNSSQQATITSSGATDAAQPVPVQSGQLALAWNSNNNNQNIIGQTVEQITSNPTYVPAVTSNPPAFLSTCHLNLQSATCPHAHTHTLFVQTGYEWSGGCTDDALLVGASYTLGSSGSIKALYEWSTWAQFRVRF